MAPAVMNESETKSIIEAVLFVSGEPVTTEILADIVELHASEVQQIVLELISEYSLKNSGLFIVEVAGGIQMVTNPACAPWVKKLLAVSLPTRLSRQSLETLAIISYKQPITKAEIEAIRGVSSDGVVRTLLERRLIKILGRKEVPGRPLMYGTTREFLQSFGLKDLSELPTLKDFQEIEEPEIPPADRGLEAVDRPAEIPEETGSLQGEATGQEA